MNTFVGVMWFLSAMCAVVAILLYAIGGFSATGAIAVAALPYLLARSLAGLIKD